MFSIFLEKTALLTLSFSFLDQLHFFSSFSILVCLNPMSAKTQQHLDSETRAVRLEKMSSQKPQKSSYWRELPEWSKWALKTTTTNEVLICPTVQLYVQLLCLLICFWFFK